MLGLTKYFKQYIITACLVLSTLLGVAQQGSISVTTQKQTVTVLLNDAGNSNKALTIDTHKGGYFTIQNQQWKAEDSTHNRTFTLVNSKDSVLYTFTKSKKGKYKECLKKIKPLLTKGQHYTLYTIALPKDPELAARIRVRRMLVCNIEVQ